MHGNFEGKWYTENLRYGRAYMLKNKETYYMELSNNITTFNENNYNPLYNANIREAILKVVI